MATSSNPIWRVGSAMQALHTGDTGTFDADVIHAGDTTFNSGTTVDFTGATVVGLTASATTISDGTGTAGFSGAAGVFSTSGITDLTMTGSGTWTGGSTGTNAVSLGNDSASLTFTGPGDLSLSGVLALTLEGSGNAAFGSVGGGSTTILDQVGSIALSGTGGLSTSALTTVVIGGSGNSSFSVTGTATLSTRSATGAYTFGDGTATGVFSGSGGLTYSGVTTYSLGFSTSASITGSGTSTLAARSGSGTATFGDTVGAWVFTGTGGLGTSSVTTLGLNASGAITMDSTGANINIGNGANNFNINIGTGGTRSINMGVAGSSIKIHSPEVVDVGSNSATICRQLPGVTDVTLAVGDVVSYTNVAGTTKVQLADANGSGSAIVPIGGCTLAATNAGNQATSFGHGDLVPVHMDATPAATSNGLPVYLSETAGRATLTAPTTAGSAVVTLGILMGANGADGIVRILWTCRGSADYIA